MARFAVPECVLGLAVLAIASWQAVAQQPQTPPQPHIDLECPAAFSSKDTATVSDREYTIPGMPISKRKLDELKKKAGTSKRRVGPIDIEDDGAYMSSGLPTEDTTNLDLGYFDSDTSKGYLGLRLRVVLKPPDCSLQDTGTEANPKRQNP